MFRCAQDRTDQVRLYLVRCNDRSPTNPHDHNIKRILAMPGDVVRYQTKKRIPLSEDDSDGGYREVDVWSRIRVPRGHCWVEGDSTLYSTKGATYTSSLKKGGAEFRKLSKADLEEALGSGSDRAGNRRRGVDVSKDSRHFGPIPLALLTGRVMSICWPPSRAGWVSARPGFVPAEKVDSPGTAGGRDWGWWPWAPFAVGWGRQREEKREEHRAQEDSHLTPYLEDVSSPGRGEREETKETEVMPLSIALFRSRKRGEQDGQGASESRTSEDVEEEELEVEPKILLHRVRPLEELNPEQKEKRKREINMLSRGGRLGELEVGWEE